MIALELGTGETVMTEESLLVSRPYIATHEQEVLHEREHGYIIHALFFTRCERLVAVVAERSYTILLYHIVPGTWTRRIVMSMSYYENSLIDSF